MDNISLEEMDSDSDFKYLIAHDLSVLDDERINEIQVTPSEKFSENYWKNQLEDRLVTFNFNWKLENDEDSAEYSSLVQFACQLAFNIDPPTHLKLTHPESIIFLCSYCSV